MTYPLIRSLAMLWALTFCACMKPATTDAPLPPIGCTTANQVMCGVFDGASIPSVDIAPREAGSDSTLSTPVDARTSDVVPTKGSALQAIAGTGLTCSTYGLPTGDKCGGVYCGVTQAQIAAALAEISNRLCQDSAADVCSQATSRKVASCARSVKNAHPLSSDADNRPRIQTCVFQDASIQASISPQCLSCYLDSAVCSGDNCLIDCLGGDSAACDKCRMDNNCTQPVPVCAGGPNPF